MPADIPKLDLTSKSIPDEQKEKLRQLFPEVFTEERIDWDQLRRTLGGEVIDEKKERFGLTWSGKGECFQIIQESSVGTLKPAKGESVDWDKTGNLFLEGDNLEVLKLLQKSYYGKIKLIYIDPPYNTGKEFIYPDKYAESLETYLAYSGQIDAEGKKFSTNTETTGRYHSNWLDMMYPRLFLARNLLREDGAIFVSIDDHEVHNLREMMNEIFGEDNFVAELVWQKKTGAGAKSKAFIGLHEYILCYAKQVSLNWEISAPMSDKTKAMYNKTDEYFSTLGPYATWPLDTTSMDERINLRFPVIHEGHEIWPKKQWLWSRERVEKAQKENKLIFNFNEKEGTWSIRFKGYLNDEAGQEKAGKPTSVLIGPYTQEGTKDFQEFFEREIFPFPKPVSLIKRLLAVDVNSDNIQKKPTDIIILDFFSGSCTTAHATLELNKEDRGDRKFIMVQLPEPTDENSEAFKAGYKTIADIGKERIRRVITKIKSEQKESAKQKTLSTDTDTPQDLGFRVFKLSKSNFKVWDGKIPANGKVEKQIELFIDHIDPHSSEEEILFEILLKSGFPLTTPVTEKKIAKKTVYAVDNDALMICLEHDLTKDLIVKIAELKPARVVCLDTGFKGNDQLRTNAMEIMKSHGVTDFRTV